MPYRRTVSTLRRWIAAARVKLVTGSAAPWSISSRLTIAFVAVAILAAAANLIVERSVILITGSSPNAASSPTLSERVVQPATPVSATSTTETLSSDELARALEYFDQSVYAASESDSAGALARYRSASNNVERKTASFVAKAAQTSGRSFATIPRALRQHQQTASRWIELSQARRKVLREYFEILDRMNARVNASLDNAFKIFGRVVARQSLVQLNTNLDEMRDSLTASMRTGASKETFAAMDAAANVFGKTLQENAKSLRRAEGDAWIRSMEADFAALASLRTTLENSHRERIALADAFVTQGSKLLAMLPESIEFQTAAVTTAPDASSLRNANSKRESHVRLQEGDGVTAAGAEMSIATATSMPVIETPSLKVEQLPTDSSQRTLVAWITAAVLALLLAICIGTVRSVVKPVRRLVAASRKIAAGQPAPNVPRGGIKELDSLAVAFNDMAQRLENAHMMALEAQQELEQKVAERTRQLQELADVDPLTSLPNRRHLFTLLNQSIDHATQYQQRIGVLFLDIDNFKNINDSVGHSFGDGVLRGIAERLQTAVQPLGFAARLGGDEFTVICDRVLTLEDVHEAGEQIIRAFQSPIHVEGRDLIIGVSVGASVFPDHERTAEALLVAADAALFNAKELGRGRVSMFSRELVAGAATKFHIEQDLRRAVERDEFELFFQPEVGIDNLQTHLVEALIRWRLPDGRYVPPGEFLSIAEESGLILEISDWVLRTAIQTAAHWYYGAWPQARVAINVSPRQLLDYRFVDRVQQLLTQFDLPPQCIEIELTESVLQTGSSTVKQLHRLRALGVAIALDDFGSGYSSLSSLEQLPLTRVKLDRSLIEKIDTNARSCSIARAIIDLCHGLDLHITAEGLERAEQFERLLGSNKLTLQGYLLSRPVPEHQVLDAIISAAQRAQELVLLSKPRVVTQRANVEQLSLERQRRARGE